MPTLNEERKKNVLEYWVNNPNQTYEQICKATGIARKTFLDLRRNEDFMKQYKELCQQRFKELEAKAIEKLVGQLDDNQWNAIKYVLDNQGYSAAQKVDLNTNTIKVTITDD